MKELCARWVQHVIKCFPRTKGSQWFLLRCMLSPSYDRSPTLTVSHLILAYPHLRSTDADCVCGVSVHDAVSACTYTAVCCILSLTALKQLLNRSVPRNERPTDTHEINTALSSTAPNTVSTTAPTTPPPQLAQVVTTSAALSSYCCCCFSIHSFCLSMNRSCMSSCASAN